MEFIERLPLKEVSYLANMSYKEYKPYDKSSSKNEDERIKNYEMMRKTCEAFIKANGEIKRLYKFTGGNNWRNDGSGSGRLFAGGCGIQGISKKIRGFLLRNTTTDIDMVNCHPVILQYICRKHSIKHDELAFYIANRDEVLRRYPDREKGKELFLKALNNDKLNKKEKDECFKSFDKECKEIQQTLTKLTCYEMIVKDVPEYKLYNWYGSAINRILCYYENKVLQNVIRTINSLNIEICSPMFDGLMVYGNHYDNTNLLETIEASVEEEFPELGMKFSYKNHNIEIQMPDDYVIPDKKELLLNKGCIFANNDLEASNAVYDLMKDNIVYSKNTLYYKCNNMWIDNQKAIESDLTNFIQNQKIYKTNSKEEIIDYVQNIKCARNVCQSLINKIISKADDGWVCDLTTSSLGKILFTNGYYNFKTEMFYTFDDEEYDHTIKFLEQIPYKFTAFTEHEIKQMEVIKNKLFYNPFGKEIGDYYMTLIARALAGDRMKRCLFGIGSSNTGKSVMTSAIKSAFGRYYGAFNAVNIAYSKTGDEAQKLRWLLLLKTKRLIISNEIQMGIEIDGNAIKKISNGGNDDIIARAHQGNETPFELVCMAIIFANDLDKITPTDDAVVNRVRAIEYKRICVDKPMEECNEFEMEKDIGLEEYIKTLEFKKVFMGILIHSYLKFAESGRVEIEPNELKKCSSLVLGANSNVIDTFKMDYELTNNENDCVVSSDVEKWLSDKKMKISMMKFGMEIKKYAKLSNMENITNKLKKLKGKTKRCWTGIKLIIETELDL